MLGNIDWRWIAIGVAIMLGLNLVASLILFVLIGGSPPRRPPIPRMPPPRSGADAWPWPR